MVLFIVKDLKVLLGEFVKTDHFLPIINDIYFPIGISFIIFTLISYLLDISNGIVSAEKNPLTFLNFILFFPKIIQGPICEFKKFKQDYEQPLISTSTLLDGIKRFIAGLSKKVLIADTVGVVAQKVFNADYANLGFGLAWYGLIAFAIQIYFDFSGYTDMAIGLGKILGFTLPENFNFPYFCTSIADFWRRWHMTLTSWFRKYVFLPLEYRFRYNKFFRQQINLIIVFFLTGLWHGATPNYIIWGIYFGLILALESAGWGKKLQKMPLIAQRFYSLILILIGWMFFRIKDISQWGPFLKALLGFNGFSGLVNSRTLNILAYFPILLIGILISIPLKVYVPDKFKFLYRQSNGEHLCIFIFIHNFYCISGWKRISGIFLPAVLGKIHEK